MVVRYSGQQISHDQRGIAVHKQQFEHDCCPETTRSQHHTYPKPPTILAIPRHKARATETTASAMGISWLIG